MAFWMLSYILFSPEVYEHIYDETKHTMALDGSIDLPRLMGESNHLDSLWLEVLRITNSSSAVRTVMQPTQIGNRVLQPGYKVMSPFRQLHFNEKVFGKNSQKCDPYRFLKFNTLAKDPSFRPFGGGSTFCHGRFIARQEVFIFIALAVHRFGVSLSAVGVNSGNTQAFPKLESERPTKGVMSPQIGEDLLVAVNRVAKI